MSKKRTKSDLKRLDAMGDKDIDYSDIPELDEAFFSGCAGRDPARKKAANDPAGRRRSGLAKGPGKGYQSRINAILRSYYEAHR